MDEIHLRRLLQENILRVEKENWDLICKEFQEENIQKSERILKETQDIADSVAIERPRRAKNEAIKQKAKSSKPTVVSSLHTKSLDSTFQPEKEPTKQSTDGHLEMHHIHFLNNYESQLQQQQWELQKKRSAYAIPLALPCQKDIHFTVEKLPKSNKKQTNKENNHLYHFIHNEGAKKLTMQKLPSITVYNRNCKPNSNISMEEIREYDEDSGCKMKTFHDKSAKMAPPILGNKNASGPFLPDRSMNQRLPRPERSIFTENFNNSQAHIDRNMLKTIVKEILEDSESASDCQLLLESSKENRCSSKMKSYQSSHSESFGKKEQKCNCHSYARNTLHTQTEEARICSTFCQTDSTSPDKLKMDSGSLRYLIQEVISEYHAFSPAEPHVKDIHRELNTPADSQKEKTVQADIPIMQRSPNLCYLSKETQVSMYEENDSPQSNIQQLTDFSGCRKINESKVENETSNFNIEQQLAAVTSKVENLVNVFNSHVIKKGELFTESIPQNKSSNNERSMHTRDVSLQFSPYLINKSAYTSPVRTLEKANQCDNYPDPNQTKKQYVDVSVQAAASLSESTNRKSTTVATQSDYRGTVTIDTWAQTEEVDKNVEVPEHSNHSSVSITPVSDSPFLDDVLSEGEIPLHLKFLSYHDHAANPNSTVAESSEEKDYSLSEGEIHPKYIQSSYDLPVLVDSFSKGAPLCTSCASLKNPKSHSEKNWNTYVNYSVGKGSSFLQDENTRQINSSTPVQNSSPSSYRNSAQYYSSDEVLNHCFSSNKKPYSHDNRRMETAINSVSEKDTNNFYRYRTVCQKPDKIPSPSNLSSLSSLDNSN